MRKNYHHSRKYRQLKYAVKQLKNNNSSKTAFTKQLILKIKRLVNGLKAVMATFRLKRLIAPALLVLGTAFQNPLAAQQFAEPVENPFGIVTANPRITAPVLVDIDDDGDLDLFASSLVSSYFADFYFQENIGNNVSPVFDSVKENPFGLNKTIGSFYPSFADLDNDGDLDFIATSSSIKVLDDYDYYPNIGITYYENIGNAKQPEFQAFIVNPFNFSVPANSDFMFPELGDLDNDGDLDILVSDSDDAIIYYQNIGTKEIANFDQPVSNPFGLIPFSYSVFLRLSDIDNDGDLDLIAAPQIHNVEADYFETRLFYYQNTGDAASPSFQIADGNQLVGDAFNIIAIPTLGDLDADGDLDIIVSQYEQTTLFYENGGDSTMPGFAENSIEDFGIHQFEVGVYTAFSNPEFVDLDADGDLDLVYGYQEHIENEEVDTVYGRIKFYENIGDNVSSKFVDVGESPFDKFITHYLAVPTLTDIDKDGDLDLFVSDYEGNVYFANNIGDTQIPQFEDLVTNEFGITTVNDDFTKLVFEDMDNDGDKDLIKSNDEMLQYFENISTNNEVLFKQVETFFNNITIEFESAIIPAITDIDNDGDYDLFIHDYQNEFYYLENTGTKENAAFADYVQSPFGFKEITVEIGREEYITFPTFSDLDADGDQDLIFGSYYGSFYFYENIDSIPVNISEVEQLNISIYPNPTNNILNLSSFESINKVEILNITGQLMKQFNNPANIISLKELPAAAYLVKITDVNGAQIVKKLYKQ